MKRVNKYLGKDDKAKDDKKYLKKSRFDKIYVQGKKRLERMFKYQRE